MPARDRFCAKCGGELVVRPEGGRNRDVCRDCGTIFYQNPLPVVGAVVLDEQRRVLLVERRYEPKQGMWCLPIGFAELDETVREASLRELEEEAGITGEVVALLDADSYRSAFYGELLIVTFEVRKTGGREQAGDDAADVRYFPLDELPTLAFPANERAIAACVTLHAEEWQMEDSFERLEEGAEGDLMSDPLVELVASHAAQIGVMWAREVGSHPSTGCLARLDQQELINEATLALTHLHEWMRDGRASPALRNHYRRLGGRWGGTGCAAGEILSSFSLLKRTLHDFAIEAGVYGRPADAYRVLELLTQLSVFFDRASYWAVRGFEEDAR